MTMRVVKLTNQPTYLRSGYVLVVVQNLIVNNIRKQPQPNYILHIDTLGIEGMKIGDPWFLGGLYLFHFDCPRIIYVQKTHTFTCPSFICE